MPNPFDRLADDLAGDLRALTLLGPRGNAALRSAMATTLAVLVALALHLDNPYWAGISGVVLVQSDRAATLARSVDRIIGTMIGAVIGYVGAGLAEDHLAFLTLAGGFTAFTLYGQERAEHGYAVLLSGITMVLILFGSLATPGKALDLAIYRGLEILDAPGQTLRILFKVVRPCGARLLAQFALRSGSRGLGFARRFSRAKFESECRTG